MIKTKYGNAKINKSGHYQITSAKEGNNGKILHRLIFEDFYQIKLPNDVVVHHIDGNKTNNNIWNLMPMSRKEHQSIHAPNQVWSEESRAKISELHKGKQISFAHRNSLSKRNKGKGNPMYGKHHSIETKDKISSKVRKHKFCNKNTYFKKNLASAIKPTRCFEMRFNKKTLPIGYFMEWISCDLINSLIEEEIT